MCSPHGDEPPCCFYKARSSGLSAGEAALAAFVGIARRFIVGLTESMSCPLGIALACCPHGDEPPCYPYKPR